MVSSWIIWIHSTTSIGILAVILNIYQIVVTVKKQRTRGWNNPPGLLILSLSCADLLTGLAVVMNDLVYTFSGFGDPNSVPLKIMYIWGRIWLVIISYTLLNSLLHMIALTAERVFALGFPFRHLTTMSTNVQVLKVLASIWLLSLLAGLSLWKTVYFEIKSVIILFTGAFFAVANFYIFRKIQRVSALQHQSIGVGAEESTGNSIVEVHKRIFKKEMRAAIYCACVVIAFVICSFPMAINTLLNGNDPRVVFTRITWSLMIFNGVCNPLLFIMRYKIVSQSYRQMPSTP